jgi:hypothetical protein
MNTEPYMVVCVIGRRMIPLADERYRPVTFDERANALACASGVVESGAFDDAVLATFEDAALVERLDHHDAPQSLAFEAEMGYGLVGDEQARAAWTLGSRLAVMWRCGLDLVDPN